MISDSFLILLIKLKIIYYGKEKHPTELGGHPPAKSNKASTPQSEVNCWRPEFGS
jgi:hypothetical protein